LFTRAIHEQLVDVPTVSVMETCEDRATLMPNNHVYPVLGSRRLATLRQSDVQAWVRNRSDALAPTTMQTVFRVLAMVLKSAVADRYLTSSPCASIKLPERPKSDIQALEPSAVLALAAQVPSRYRALIVAAAGTGLRQGELFGLTVDRVDFLRRSVKVDRQLVMFNDGSCRFGTPKTEASYRTVPLPQIVVDEMAAHLALFPAESDGLVFTSPRGGSIRRNRFHESVWAPGVAAVGLPKGTRFHALRHTYASLLIEANEPPKVIQERLGHASITETMDTYGHLYPASDERTRQAIDAALSLTGDRFADPSLTLGSAADQ
jgi:integrase